MKLYDKPAHILHDMLREKKINAVELTKDIIARMEKVEPKVAAYLMVTSEIALQQAQAVDKKIAGGEEITFLEGIPGLSKIISARRVLRRPVLPRSSNILCRLITRRLWRNCGRQALLFWEKQILTNLLWAVLQKIPHTTLHIIRGI